MNDLVNKIFKERLKMFGGDVSKVCYPEKELSNMTNEEFRKYITLFCEIGYDSLLHESMNDYFKDKKKIENELNVEFDRRLGKDFITIYNILDESNTEKWCGDVRYKLLSYTFKGYTEFSNLKKTKAIISYINENNLSIDLFVGIYNLMRESFYWDMSNEESLNGKYKDEFIDYLLGDIKENEVKDKPWNNNKFMAISK